MSTRMSGYRILLLGIAFLVPVFGAVIAQDQKDRDPHVMEDGRGLQDDPRFISPPTVSWPIYACGTQITVKNFRTDAFVEVYIDGSATPIATKSGAGQSPDIGVVIDVGMSLTDGRQIFARQVAGSARSDPSNVVPVTSHTADYPAGLPKPRLFKHPLLACGRAVLVEDVVPNATVEIVAENHLSPGVYAPATVVGSFQATPEWGLNWSGVNPRFGLQARITARAKLCTDPSPPSEVETVESAPSPPPTGSLAAPVVEGSNLVTVWGAGGVGDPPQHGALVRIFDRSALVGSSAIPGGAPHRLGISPVTSPSSSYQVTQELCDESKPSEPLPAQPCSALPVAKIQPPLPGDQKIYVTQSYPGAQIHVFVGGEELGNSGGNVINLKRPLNDGEEVRVLQILNGCRSRLVYVIKVECALGQSPGACSSDWPAFRHSGVRTARQIHVSPVSDPYQVKRLAQGWPTPFVALDGGVFTASPVVSGDLLYIGSSAGHLYAVEAATGKFRWQYPPRDEPALLSRWGTPQLGDPSPCANPSSQGLPASVTVAQIERRQVVILGAPDRGRPSDPGGRFGNGFGSGRLFAIDAQSGDLVWKSEELARMSGLTDGDTREFHEQIGYSSPLVLGNRIYVGTADNCDNPIQRGRVVAVDLFSGSTIPGFSFASTGTRGGGIWNSIAGGLGDGIFATTGNTRSGNPGGEPSPNHGLSMIGLNPTTGNLEGKLQPVPFDKDQDPDWAAGAALSNTSCGPLALSTMKDGWTYAARLGPPLAFHWQFPNTAYPFPGNDPNVHGDIRYHRAGATWNDVFITMAGGEDIVLRDTPGDIFTGYRRLHALNACAGPGDRVRWIADLVPFTNEPPPGASAETLKHYWGLGPPTVTHGIVYVGTNAGYILAIADPSVWPAQGSWCSWGHAISNSDCSANGFPLVPKPTILKAINLGTGSLQRTEPVIAGGRIFAATDTGRLFMLEPR